MGHGNFVIGYILRITLKLFGDIGKMAISTMMKKLSIASLLAALSVAEFGIQQVQAASFNVTIEAPGVQQSSLVTNSLIYAGTGVTVENFDSTSTGYYQSFNTSIGTYNNSIVQPNNVWGGANGSQYIIPNNQSSLTLNSPQRYFGLWWSAGDSTNIMDFYSGSTLVGHFTTADVISFLNTQPNTNAYYGNPNSGGNGGEPYAFLNFFADPNNPNVTFDKIVFTSRLFESDNHTIAATYSSVSGTSIYQSVPEPTSTLGLLGLSALFVGSTLKRKQQK